MIYETNAKTPREAYERLRTALVIVSAGVQRDAARNSCWLTGAAVAVHAVEDSLATTPKSLPEAEPAPATKGNDKGWDQAVPPRAKKRSKMGRAMLAFVKLFFGLAWVAACAVGLWWVHARYGVVLEWWCWLATIPGIAAFMDGAFMHEEDQLAEREDKTIRIITKDATKRKRRVKFDTSDLEKLVRRLEDLADELKDDPTEESAVASASKGENGEDEV